MIILDVDALCSICALKIEFEHIQLFKNISWYWMQWFTFVILTTKEAGVGRISLRPDQAKSSQDLTSFYNKWT
jgi:hypothetical protein